MDFYRSCLMWTRSQTFSKVTVPTQHLNGGRPSSLLQRSTQVTSIWISYVVVKKVAVVVDVIKAQKHLSILATTLADMTVVVKCLLTNSIPKLAAVFRNLLTLLCATA